MATSIVKALRSLVVYAKYTRREPEGLFRAIHLFGAVLEETGFAQIAVLVKYFLSMSFGHSSCTPSTLGESPEGLFRAIHPFGAFL